MTKEFMCKIEKKIFIFQGIEQDIIQEKLLIH